MTSAIPVALAAALVPLNSTLVALAIPVVADDLGASVGATSTVVTLYLVAMIVVQPIAGRVGDLLSRVRVLRVGVVAFALASAVAAMSPNLSVLVVSRAVQGVCGAIVLTNALAHVREQPAQRRGGKYGVVGAFLGAAPAVGLPIGGALVETVGWTGIFWLNVPLGALVLLAMRSLDEAPRARTEGRGFGPVAHVLRRRGFTSAVVSMGLANFALYAALLATPLIAERRIAAASLAASLMLAAMSAAMAVASPLGGRVADRMGRRPTAIGGLALVTVALLAVSLVAGGGGITLLATCLVLTGVGLGVANVALFTAGVEALDERDAGVAAGLLSTARYLGAILASGLLMLVTSAVGAGEFMDVKWVLWGGAGSTALAILVGMGLDVSRRRDGIHPSVRDE